MNKRNYNLDYLRILACFMVVFLHISAQNFYNVNVYSKEWQCFNVYGSVVRSSVPLFLMISGKLFLSKEKEINIFELQKKNIFKIVVLYFSWSMFYAVVRMFRNGVTYDNILENLLCEMIKSNFHLWYLPTLISVYLLVPILWLISHYKDGKLLNYCCLLFLIFGPIKSTFNEFPYGIMAPLNNIFNKFSFALADHTGYFLLGYFLDKNINKFEKISNLKLILSLVIVILISVFITKTYSWSVGKPTVLLYRNFSISVFIEAILFFVIFLKIPKQSISQRIRGLLIKVSKLTLFIYLFHPFVIDCLAIDFKITNLSFNPLFSIPLLSLLVFLICLLLGFIFDKVPFINKWLM